jgi:peptidoglycan/LPS O-acetylase OafA/YrhL
MNHQEEKDDRHGMVIGGLIVLGLGVIFLLANLDIIPDFGEMWPLVLVVIGVALLVGALVKKEAKKEKDEDRFQNT